MLMVIDLFITCLYVTLMITIVTSNFSFDAHNSFYIPVINDFITPYIISVCHTLDGFKLGHDDLVTIIVEKLCTTRDME